MHLVSKPVYQRKLASLRAADEFGRRSARDLVTLQMAKEAGRLFASDEYPELIKAAGISKEAWDSMSEMEKQAIFGRLVKSLGGLARKAVGGVAKGVGGAMKRMPKLRKAPVRVSGRRSVQARRAAAAAQPKPPLTPKTRAAAQKQYLQKNVQRAQEKGVQGAPTTRPSHPAPTPQPQAQVAPGPAAAPQSRTGPGYQRMEMRQTPQGVQASPMGAGGTGAPAAAPGRPGTVAQGPAMQTGQAGQRPYSFEGGAAAPAATPAARQTGTVAQGPAGTYHAQAPRQAAPAPARGTTASAEQYADQLFGTAGGGPEVSSPTARRAAAQAVGGVAPGPRAAASVKARNVRGTGGTVKRRKGKQIQKAEARQAKAQAKQQKVQDAAAAEEAARAAAEEKGPVTAGGGAAPGSDESKGILSGAWKHRRLLAGGALLGAGYGLYKGVPWAARQLEATSQTPMAYGGGWSPVNYGYGSNPYGAGQGGYMGPGA